ncbi:MAG: DUF4369 domain-containing protein [Muribaculum sp.]|nr:DUF4369 domain-containing protein [Muribaculum sp.]
MKHFFAKTCVTIFGSVMLIGCGSSNKWKIDGNVAGADSQNLILQVSENGRWFTIDTIATDKNGNFSYAREAASYPDIYRLNLDGKSIYFPIDSIEYISLNANSDNFDQSYQLSGSPDADMMMTVEKRINETVKTVGSDKAVSDSLLKRDLSGMILSNPGSIMAYYVINKQINGKHLFNPANPFDNRIIGAVANAYNEFRPNDPRTRYLAEVFLRNRPAPVGTPLDTIEVTELPFFDINLMDNTGATHNLTDVVARNKVVVLSFTVYGAEGSTAYNVALADAYDKYRAKGMEIYQVAVDNDEFQWKQSAKNLPWITVYNPLSTGGTVLNVYNVRNLPTTYVLANGELVDRVDDLSQLNQTIAKYL